MQLIPIALCLIIPGYLSAVHEVQPWQKRHAEGWAWYHDFERPKEEEKPPERPTDPILILRIEKENLERALAKAMLEPTPENTMSYMILQKKWISHAAEFSRSWQYSLLEHPELASMTPTTQYGVQIKKEQETIKRNLLIKALAHDHTLLFFYEGGSAYSQAFSNVVKAFVEQHHWNVKSVSVDGVILKDFPLSINDKSIAKEMGVTIFPAIFIANTTTLSAVPVAFGMSTVSQVEDNIVMQFGELK